MRSQGREMWGKRILTEFLLVEEVFGLLSMPFDAVTWHTTLDAALTWSCCRTITQSWLSTPKKTCTTSWNGKRTVIACQMGLLAVYASSVGLFLLHHWFGDTGGVGNVGALALDGGGGHCCRHGWVGVSRGDDCLQRGGWEDVCRRGREGW
jgi:hypothetical protein